MNCPLCKQIIEEPKLLEEIFQEVKCGCGDYKIEYWDYTPHQEVIYLGNDIMVKNFLFIPMETVIFKIYHEHDGGTTTKPIAYIPFIKKIISKQDLENKIRMYMVFS